MRPTVTDRVTWSVCRSVCHDHDSSKNSWMRYCMGCGLRWEQGTMYYTGEQQPWGSRSPIRRGNFEAERGSPSIGTLWHELCKNGWTDRDVIWDVDPGGSNVLDGVHIGATWRIRLNRPCASAMWPFCQLLWPLLMSWQPKDKLEF